MNAEVRSILAPLNCHRTQVFESGNGSSRTIGGIRTTDPHHPTITHDEFVMQHVLPALSGACVRFGIESIARDIMEITEPLYQNMELDSVALFLSRTLRGGSETDEVSPHARNQTLAEKHGMKYVFAPIVELGLAHRRTDVFDETKFFSTHACRMGELITNYPEKHYHEYIDLCVILLENGIYDWSMENSPEEWGSLQPSIRQFGLKAVLGPMAQALIDVGHFPGTKDDKYHYSFLASLISGLYPYILPRTRRNGVKEMDAAMRSIVSFIRHLGSKGAFRNERSGEAVRNFFYDFSKNHLVEIIDTGLPATLGRIRNHYEHTLVGLPVA